MPPLILTSQCGLAIDWKKTVEDLREHGIILTSERVDIIDPLKEFQPGSDVRGAIRSSMQAADMVVVVSSRNAARSDWVNYEAGMASALEKPVIILATPGADKSLFAGSFANVRMIEVGKASG